MITHLEVRNCGQNCYRSCEKGAIIIRHPTVYLLCFRMQSSKVFRKFSRLQSVLLCYKSSKHVLKIKFLTCLNTQSSGTLFLHWLWLRQAVKISTNKCELPILMGKSDFVVEVRGRPQEWCLFSSCCSCRLPVWQQSFCTCLWSCEIPVCSK